MQVQLNRADWLVAAVCGGWMVAFDASQGSLHLVMGILVVPATVLLRVRPGWAAASVLAVTVTEWVLGGPVQTTGGLLPIVASFYALGRYAPVVQGLIFFGLFQVLLAGSGVSGWTVANLPFGCVLLGGPWIFGRLVRHRTEKAVAAEQLLAAQALLDPAARASAVVAQERARLAAEVVAVVRSAVLTMRNTAAGAAQDLDRDALSSIQHSGRSAIAELRRLLGLLHRQEPSPAAPQPPVINRRRYVVDIATALVLAGLTLLEAVTEPIPAPFGALSLVLSAMLTLTVGLRQLDPAIACVAATAVCTLSLALGAPLVSSVAGAVAMILLAWSVATNGSRWCWTALAGLLVADIAQVLRYDPYGAPSDFLAFALGAASGYLWAERHRVERAALARTAALRAESDEHVHHAVRAERLRIARELHDVASHAVSVMVLQAGAAQALRGRDDNAARNAVVEIEQAGNAALAELAVLAQVLDPAEGSHPLDPTRPLNSAVGALIDRLRSGGVTVDTTIADLADPDPAVAGAVHRVVQECLTNVLRHAPGSTVKVTVFITAEGGADSVEVHVRDTGDNTQRPAGGSDSGFGLAGLAERVRGLGGDLAAGPHPDGGFAVRARIPLHPAPRQSVTRPDGAP